MKSVTLFSSWELYVYDLRWMITSFGSVAVLRYGLYSTSVLLCNSESEFACCNAIDTSKLKLNPFESV